MSPEVDEIVALLERTPTALKSLLQGLPEAWIRSDEGEGTWTVFDIIGHLAYAERVDWIPRMRMILEHGESKAFEPFDRLGQIKEGRDAGLEELLDRFAERRAENLEELRAMELGPKQLALRGKHPSFGRVTLGELLATWAAHDMTHLHQIARVMAHQLHEAVGPWSRFLGVLKCGGHSEGA